MRLDNPLFIEAQSSGRSTFGIKKYIDNFSFTKQGDLLIPRGMRSWLLSACLKMSIDHEVMDERTVFDHIDINSSNIKYRPYQADAVMELVTGDPEVVLISPAGSGKTVIGISLVPLFGQPTLWLTHTGPLATQAIKRVESFLPDIGEIGYMGQGKWIKGDILTVGMIQTLSRNPEKLIEMRNDFGLVVLDECHHCPAKTFTDVVSYLNPYYLVGLTATPNRRDKLEMLMFQTIGLRKIVIPMEKVRHYGGIILPEVRYRTVRSEKVKTNNIQQIIKKYIVKNDARTNIIVKDVLSEARAGHFCIVVSDRREHCNILYEKIKKIWPKTGIATGKYSKKHVKEQVEAFDNGNITVLVATFSLLGEGFDVPFLDRAFIGMPFRAESKAEQLVGRIQRACPNKKDAIVYDYVDSDIGVLADQFYNKNRACRCRVYSKLGMEVKSY